ncbi:MAG TPA: hypothetical protein VKN14_12605 [Flavobacteriaceae bacterium]|nr:hypothetical protein [Flavobacteriaceae bacterium]
MNGLDIVMVIAIILFARLGIRLLVNFKNREKSENNDNKKE